MSLVDTLDLTPPQRDAAVERARDVSVTAGAGSGKTRTLVARYLALLAAGSLPRGVVAVTFTEKAAREMRNRIRSEVQRWLAGGCPPAERTRWEEIEADIDAARIGTIHGLCAAILRAHPAEAAIDPEFEVLEEGLSAALAAQAVEDSLTWAVGQADLVPLFSSFTIAGLEKILSKLIRARLEAQAALAVADAPALWNIALVAATLAFTTSDEVRGAVGELRSLAAPEGGLQADAGEKLAEQVRALLAEWTRLEQALAAGQIVMAAEALFTVRREHSRGKIGSRTSRAKGAVGVLRERYDAQVDPWLGGKTSGDEPPDADLEAQVAGVLPRLERLFQHAVEAYTAAKDRRQALDFDDLEAKALALLRQPDVRARWQRQIDALLVDEFQDTNERQREIVEAFAGVAEGRTGRLFIVGDAKQSIYRFRGADVSVFRRLDEDIQARGGLPLTLDLTFRAHEALVDVLNEVLAAAMTLPGGAARPYLVPFAPLSAYHQSPRSGAGEPYLEFLYGLGQNGPEARSAGARLLAERLIRLQTENGVRWEDVALLFRASTGFPYYEAGLESAGIPFITVAGRGFYDRPEIRDLLNILRALADPWDDLALAGLLRSPAFGLTDSALYLLRWPPGAAKPNRLCQSLSGELTHLSDDERRRVERARENITHLENLVDRMPVAELLKRILDKTHYPAILAAALSGARLQRNVDKLLADAHASGLVRVMEFLEYVETLRSVGAREGEAPAETGGAVRLMTVHKAKGLEFPVVVLADASYQHRAQPEPALLSPEQGLIPRLDRLAQDCLAYRLARVRDRDREEAENMRLIYVAATRARDKLIVCGHEARGAGGDSWLVRLAAAAGISLDLAIQNPGQWQISHLPQSGQSIGALAGEVHEVTAMAAAPQSAERPVVGASLYQPLVPMVLAESFGVDAEAVRQTRRVTTQRRTDAAIVGRLVHQALRRWKFPGDAGFDPVVQAAAREDGLASSVDIANHLDRVAELLGRLKADPRWVELDQAERHHEVPYGMTTGNRLETGVIDLLYRAAVDGTWTLIDFKTDALHDAAAMQHAYREQYAGQIGRYQQAATALLHQQVRTSLCFLDVAGHVAWVAL